MKTILASLLCLAFPVFALVLADDYQGHNHDLHHAQYQTWQSNSGFNCCNDRDCGELPEDRIRENGQNIEVKVDDEWCPVLHEHLLKVGKSPDWSKAHACILAPHSILGTPCQRFKCFVDRAKF